MVCEGVDQLGMTSGRTIHDGTLPQSCIIGYAFSAGMPSRLAFRSDVRSGSWLCKNAKTLDVDRTS
jgi:hypothetical protein